MKGAIKIQNITSTYILILTLAATLILAIFGVEKSLGTTVIKIWPMLLNKAPPTSALSWKMASSSCNQFPLCSQHT